MRATVQTYRLGLSAEVEGDIQWAIAKDEVICDQSARTIADWFKTPNTPNLLALATNGEFVIEQLHDEIEKAGMDPREYSTMVAWLENLATILREES